jgi:hypothetical protein
MAVKKPIRRKRTRGRNFAGVEKAVWSSVKTFRSNRWMKSPVTPVAVAFVALVGVLMLAYSASTPPQPMNGEQSAARAEVPATPAPERTRPTAAPAIEEKPRAAADPIAADERESFDGITTGPTPTVVTLTGCLVRSDKNFRLNDTSGTNAPKSRSWKSGFLAKRSASVSIVPASSELPLAKHVGERVTVSGTLIERQMQVRTLRRVSSSCGSEDPAPRITA